MPECPDVESWRRLVQDHALDDPIADVQVLDAGVIRNRSMRAFRSALIGCTFEPADRLGKWLLVPTDRQELLFHFGMTGSLYWQPNGEGVERFDRVVVSMARGDLVFRDQRKLRGIWLAKSEAEKDEVIGMQGPDVATLNREELFACLESRKASLKPSLMDQHVMAGIGNMLSDEILWRAKLHPSRKFQELSNSEKLILSRSFTR